MAASLAARLRTECNVQVETVQGGLGEFSVLVEGQEVVSTSRLWYPSLGKVFQVVKARLQSEGP
jgi:hypothetical protein